MTQNGGLNTAREPTPVTLLAVRKDRCGFGVGVSHRRRGSVLGR